MRTAFIRTLTDLAKSEPRILLLTGDLGYMALEPFAEAHPDRFLNVGAAEQNMVGVATGLAEAGFIPFVYSIVPFAVLRPYEFIRNGPIQHRFPVRVVGVGGGFEYGTNGLSHMGLEDIAVMRAQPGIQVIVPADPHQASNALLATWESPCPIYYRIGKDDKQAVPGLDGRFEPGKLQRIGDGTDLLFITMGAVATEAAGAVALLAARGVRSSLVVVAAMNPAPEDELALLLRQFQVVFSVEAHYCTGGLGSLLAEVMAERGIPCRLVNCGVNSTPDGMTGSQRYFHRRYGLSSEKLAERAMEVLSIKSCTDCHRS
jgi:transketolase